MRGIRLAVLTTAGLLVLPQPVLTAGAAPTTSPLPPDQQAAAAPASARSGVAGDTRNLGTLVREHQRARLDEMRREHAQIRAQADALVEALANTRNGSPVLDEECRLMREIALALCAAAREEEGAMLRLEQLLELRDRAPDSDRRRERDVDRHTSTLEQHLGSMTYDLAELLKTIEAMRSRMAGKP